MNIMRPKRRMEEIAFSGLRQAMASDSQGLGSLWSKSCCDFGGILCFPDLLFKFHELSGCRTVSHHLLSAIMGIFYPSAPFALHSFVCYQDHQNCKYNQR